MNTIHVKTKNKEYHISAGKPVIVHWKAKNKTRAGESTAVGWIKPGEKPHTITLIHSCFQTHDKVEQEYTSSWTIWDTQIIDIRPLSAMKGL